MPRITRNSARLATNGSSASTTGGTELLAPSTTITSTRSTRSQAVNDRGEENTEEEAPIVIRRSTRRAALDAKARIAEESKREFERKRRSTRRNVNTNREDAVVNQQQSPSQPSPLENNNNSLDLKPAALPSGSKARGGALLFKSDENALEEEDVSQLEEFTCAICLDKPDTLVDLATISGCSHKFCFDCIDKWAETENKCPCCKQRFNRIDRVKKLPPPATPPTSSRRGKRKRSDNTNNSGSNTRRRTDSSTGAGGSSSPPRAAGGAASSRVNSRTVEDRNQQHLPAGLSFAVLESIFNSAFMGAGGFGPVSQGGRTTFRFPVPPSMAGDGDLDDMAGMLRAILQDATIGGPGSRFTVQVRRTGPASPAGSDGREVHQAAARASGGASRASSGVAGASGATASRSSSSPRRRAGSSSRGSSNNESRTSRQRSSLFSYFSSSPSSRRARGRAASGASSAARPASRSDSGVIDLADSESDT
eukprot:scaffold26769_cov187-Skeletonema_menzelii.AAC.2